MRPNEVAAAIGVVLVGRLPHGENAGAYAVRTADGTDAVLKVGAAEPDEGVPEIVDVLRARGYPIPRVLRTGSVDGDRYELIELVRGAPLDHPEARHLSAVRALVELQRRIGVGTGHGWIEHMVTSVTDGLTGYCEHGAMREHSAETRRLLERLRRLADARRDVDVATEDAVHYDFSPFNILVDGDQVSGVVDWDAARVGDGAFDLVTLAYYTYSDAVRDELLAIAGARTSAPALVLYAAHMVLRQVDWSLRHDPSTVDWFMGIGDALLDKVAR